MLFSDSEYLVSSVHHHVKESEMLLKGIYVLLSERFINFEMTQIDFTFKTALFYTLYNVLFFIESVGKNMLTDVFSI